MQSIKNILASFNPTKDKYISREFQKYGYDLSEELGDFKHKALYMKLAKTIPRPVLEKARNFVKDAGSVRSKPKLFMWKLGQLQKEWRERQQIEGKGHKPRSLKPGRIHLIISGDVIGVGFRSWVFLLASNYGITGWVKNTSNRKVEILFEGEEEALARVVPFCEKGPATAKVTEVVKEKGSYTGEFITFEIKHS